MSLAPVALFAYNRPYHLEETVNALKKNAEASETELYIFCDGAKKAKDPAITKVREVAHEVTGFKSVTVIEAPKNKGLARSIIDGVTHVVTKHGKLIVMEDDLVTSKYFLQYMNEGLEKYKDNEKVGSVHSYVYPVAEALPENFFLRGADCLGWGTWSRAWEHFEEDGQKLLDELKRQKLTSVFDLDNSYPYSKMLEDQIAGRNNSWAIRWHASLFLANKLTLYPGRSLNRNIGFDGTGTNSGVLHENAFRIELEEKPLPVLDIPTEENKEARRIFANHLRQLSSSFIKRLKKLTNKVVNKLRGAHIKFFGPYSEWEKAQKKSTGYNQHEILQKVESATQKVLNKEAAYEQDSLAILEPNPHWELIELLEDVSKKNNGHLSVLDFGGSLGGSYFRSRPFVKNSSTVSWHVIEQEHYVTSGKKLAANNELNFFYTIEESIASSKPNFILLSSSIQYIDKAWDILQTLTDTGAEILFIDRTPFSDKDQDLVALQKVPPTIYKASYPCWIFSEQNFKKKLSKHYRLENEHATAEGTHRCGSLPFSFKAQTWRATQP